MPVAIAYDLVLEDHILAHQQREEAAAAVQRELAEMVRYAVGYRSRAFVTFGAPIHAPAIATSHSRSDVLELARLVRARIGALYKVLPTALFAAAMRPSITRRDLEGRIDRLIEELAARQRQPRRHQRPAGGRRGRRAARDARHRRRRARPVPRARAHRAALLRADDRAPARHDRPDALVVDARQRVQSLFPPARPKPHPQDARVALRHAPADELRAPVHRRRDRRRSDRGGARASKRAACC